MLCLTNGAYACIEATSLQRGGPAGNLNRHDSCETLQQALSGCESHLEHIREEPDQSEWRIRAPPKRPLQGPSRVDQLRMPQAAKEKRALGIRHRLTRKGFIAVFWSIRSPPVEPDNW